MTSEVQAAAAEPQIARSIPLSLFAFSIFYGGMVCIAGVLGAKQVALGPLAVEAGIFPFLLLVAMSSAIAELHGRPTADRLVRFGFVPLITAILLTLFVLQLPHDKGMYPPAVDAFPIILGQSWRMMLAGEQLIHGSEHALNTAFWRTMGCSPRRYAREAVAVTGAS